MDELEIAEFVLIDKRIDTAEESAFDNIRESLRARWEFGKRMLAMRKGKKLPIGEMAKLIEATSKSQVELSYRARFAERYPTEDAFCTGCAEWTSWVSVKRSLPKPKSKRKTDLAPKPKPESKPAPKQDDPRLAEIINDMEDADGKYAAKEVVDKLSNEGLNVSVDTVERKRNSIRAERKAQKDAVVISWDSLPATAQKKLEIMRRQVRKELETEFEPRIQAEVQRRVGVSRKEIDRLRAEARRVLDSRKGIFTRDDYNLIRSCLHPDSRLSVTDEKLTNAFRLFNGAEILFLNEKDRPTTTLPATAEELFRKNKTK